MRECRSYPAFFSCIQYGTGCMGRLPAIADCLAITDAKAEENWYQRYLRSRPRVSWIHWLWSKSEPEALTHRLHYRIAGINLGRLIWTIQCNAGDFTYCLLGSSMLVVGEMSTGVIVACVPTLGPVFSPSRFEPSAKARFQYKDIRRTHFTDGSSDRTPIRGPASDIFHERPYTTLEGDHVESKGALKLGNDYHVHAGRASVSESSDRHIHTNKIGVREDLHVFETPRRGWGVKSSLGKHLERPGQ